MHECNDAMLSWWQRARGAILMAFYVLLQSKLVYAAAANHSFLLSVLIRYM